MDLISRQAAIDAMKCISDSICEQQAIDALCGLPSADVPHWISCSERLPEEGQWCLVSDKGHIAIDTFIGHGNPYNWHWYVRDYEAWMPLPEPYKEVEQNG